MCILLLVVQFTETVIGFGASLFGNRFIYRNQYMPTKPGLAYKLRKPYAQKYGSFGDNFINMVCILKLALVVRVQFAFIPVHWPVYRVSTQA